MYENWMQPVGTGIGAAAQAYGMYKADQDAREAAKTPGERALDILKKQGGQPKIQATSIADLAKYATPAATTPEVAAPAAISPDLPQFQAGSIAPPKPLGIGGILPQRFPSLYPVTYGGFTGQLNPAYNFGFTDSATVRP